MRKLLVTLGILAIAFCTSAQNDTIEKLRKEGYQARLADDYQKSIEKYSAIIELSPNDYDAKLALGRLYFMVGDYTKAINYFDLIYKFDTTDVEAMFGFGKCYIWLENYPEAIYWLKRSLKFLPDFAPAYLELGRTYSYYGKLDSAIWAYQNTLFIDSTHSTAWAGLGRMHYWKSLPVSASRYYRKALEVDPEDESIQKEYDKVRKELNYKTGISLQKIQEKEPTYVIDAIVQKYTFQKRITDKWMINTSISLDHSIRDFDHDEGDTVRWFDNSWLKVTYISEYHKLSTHAGYSISDKVLSTYGAGWNFRKRMGEVKLNNALTAGYSYFYYWKQAGKYFITDNFMVERKKWNLGMGISTGKVNDAEIRKYTDQNYDIGKNPFLLVNSSLYYRLIKKPQWKLGATYSFYDFKYKSPDYYTPYERHLYGPTSSLYYKSNGFYLYASFSYMLGNESFYYLDQINGNTYIKDRLDVDNWSGSFDIGYTWKIISFSLGGSRFVNPFYENYNLYATLRLEL